LLPTSRDHGPPSPIPAKEVTKVALRLKYQIEQVVPCELEEDLITKPHSNIVTEAVIKTAKEAGGDEYKACVVFCLLVVKRWFKRQALKELWDADLHNARGVAAEMIAKRIIEAEEDLKYLFQDVLLNRYRIIVDGEESAPTNAVEKAVDLHALHVIGSSSFQVCVNQIWHGSVMKDDEDRFIEYPDKTNTNYWAHFDPDRIRVPLYQNAIQIGISVLYLILYTGSINISGGLDAWEVLLYLFTLGFICEEVRKFWKVGRFYLGFWNVFNCTLYALLTTAFVCRLVALGHSNDHHYRNQFDELAKNFLAISAPMFWMRLLLYLDTFQFFGAMLVVLKVLMKESIYFFALLMVVLLGFLQAFIGLDLADNEMEDTGFIIQAMLNAIMQSPEFDGFDNFAPPFGIVLYYIFTFLVMVILLNVLIALYNSAYEDITTNAVDEFMALKAQKTLQFVRAPDEHVFVAPFNLIELLCIVVPFEWWLPEARYERLNDLVMLVIYSPVLLITSFIETKRAHKVQYNRRRGEADDDVVEEWEQMLDECDFEADGFAKKVQASAPNVEVDLAVLEVRKLREEVGELKKLIEGLKSGGGAIGGSSASASAWGTDTLQERNEDGQEDSDGKD
jgi:hypothetical protein